MVRRYVEDNNDYDVVQGLAEDNLYSGGSKRRKYIRNRLTYEYELEISEDILDGIKEVYEEISDEDVYSLDEDLLVEFDENKHSLAYNSNINKYMNR